MKWPPDSANERLDAIRKARSWWSGVDLAKHAGEHFWTAKDPTAGEKWTKPTIRKEHRIHVPVAADLSLVAADHLFGGGIELPAGDARLNELAEQVSLSTLMPVAAERASGMGEVYLEVGWRDRTVPMLNVVDADRVVPEFSWGRMVAAEVGADLAGHRGRRWIYVKRFEPGIIYHRLYQRATGVTTNPLVQQPLAQHPETAALQPVSRMPAGISDRLALTYVPNARPKSNRAGGASDTEGAEPLMAAVDEVASGLQRDFRLGKGRLVVSEWLLDRTKPLDGTLFDTNAEIFSPIGSTGEESMRNDIVPYQPDIRVTQHLDAVRDYIMRIVSSAGYSPDSLIVNRVQLPESGIARRLREAASIRTTQRKIAIWRPAIAEVLSSLMVVAYGGTPPVIPVSIRSAYAPDIAETANVVAQLAAASAASTETKVRLVHPTWDDEQVANEVERILEERQTRDAPDEVLP